MALNRLSMPERKSAGSWSYGPPNADVSAVAATLAARMVETSFTPGIASRTAIPARMAAVLPRDRVGVWDGAIQPPFGAGGSIEVWDGSVAVWDGPAGVWDGWIHPSAGPAGSAGVGVGSPVDSSMPGTSVQIR